MRISDWSSDVCSSDLKAVDYAATSVLPIEIEAIGSNQPTLVGSLTSEPSPPLPTARLRIGLAGYGVVGQALAARLCYDPRFAIAAILVRHPLRERGVPPRAPPPHDLGGFVDRKFDIRVAALSCDGEGAALCGRAESHKTEHH